MPNPVVHFEVGGKDAQKLQRFYTDAFGWRVDADNPMNYGVVDTQCDGSGINGGISPADDRPNWVTFYVEVDDPDAYLKKIEGMGGKTIRPTTVIPGMVTYALFADPEGNVVGLVKSG